MNDNLDDLISAHREGARLTDEQLARNRARLLSRVAAGVAVSTVAAGAGTSTAAAAASHVGASVLIKVAIGVAVVGGAGAAFMWTRPASRPAEVVGAPPAVIATQTPLPAPAEPVAIPTPVVESPSDPVAAAPRAPKPSSSNTSSLASEIQLMHDVEAALSAGQPARALSLLDGWRSGGTMGEERAAARVVTLCRLGRVDEARADAARFVRDRPRSPLIERVRSTCAKGGEPTKAGGSR